MRLKSDLYKISPLRRHLNRHLERIKTPNRQGTGALGLENHKTETIVDTTKMSAEEKEKYIKEFMNRDK